MCNCTSGNLEIPVRVFDAPRNDMEKIAPAKVFFIIFVDGIFTTLFEWLFTNVFDVTAPTQVIPCVYRRCNAD
jgi:hypothetical protein